MHSTASYTAGAAVALAVVFLFVCAPGAGAADDAGAPAPSAAAARTHVLFMGADLALAKQMELLPVQDVQEHSLFVADGDETLEVDMSPDMVLEVKEVLKIADTSVEIGRFKAERAYTPEADPFVKFAEAARVSSAMADARDEANARLNHAVAAEGMAQANVNAATPETRGQAMQTLGSAQASVAEAQATVGRAESMMRSDVFDVASQSSRMGTESAQEMFDAIRVTFEIAPEHGLTQPFVAVVARIRERDGRPHALRKWIYVRALDPMAAGESRKVTVYRGGMSPGYVLENCEVHVYDQGREVATNLSRKRVELTADDVLQYRIVEYIGANRGRTLPASLLSEVAPGGAGARLTPAQREPTYHLVVNKAGKVTAACLDDSGKVLVQDPAVDAVLKALRFYPALRDGKPIETVLPFRIDRID